MMRRLQWSVRLATESWKSNGGLRFISIVRKDCSTKSNSSSFQPCSISSVSILLACKKPCQHHLLTDIPPQWTKAFTRLHVLLLTPWQTTQRGSPSGSSHSPSLRGNITLLSFAVPDPPISLAIVPRFRCCHSFVTCSMVSSSALPREEVTARNSLIQSRSCLTQCHGSDQSSKMTRRVSGINGEVKRVFSKGAKEGVDSDRRWIDSRASMSTVH